MGVNKNVRRIKFDFQVTIVPENPSDKVAVGTRYKSVTIDATYPMFTLYTIGAAVKSVIDELLKEIENVSA